MKVLVTGGRFYDDEKFFNETLDALHKEYHFTALIEGGADGADYLAFLWAHKNGILQETYPAPWKKYGKAAGAIRNQQMIDEGKPDIVIAFPGNNGTKDMVNRTIKHNIKLINFGTNNLETM